MTFGWAILTLFFIGYAAMSGATLWHLETYSFSRSSRLAVTIFIIAAIILAASAVIFFAELDWDILGGILQTNKTPSGSI